MVKIKTNTVLKDFKGVPLKQGEQELTVGDAISIALGGKSSNPTLGYILGKKFANDKEVELKAEDVVFVKKTLEESEVWLGIVVGQIIELLEGNDEKPGK